MKVSGRPVLCLYYFSVDTAFYKIHCRASGAYENNTHWEDLQYVRVLIDPETGNLVDILEPNYFYDYAPEGDNCIFVTSSYRWSYVDVSKLLSNVTAKHLDFLKKDK